MSNIHMDHKVLNELQEVMEGEFPVLLDIFLSDSDQRLDQLHQATDLRDVTVVAHSFKGSSSNMGAIRLAHLCGQLEERALKKQLSDIKELVIKIDHEYQMVRQLYWAERQRFPLHSPANT